MANPDALPTPRRDFRLQEMDGETLLYRHSLKKTIYLNDSATAVWRLCDGQRSVRQIVDMLADVYPEARAAIAADVNEAIDRLFKEGALRLEMPAANN